jgi:hypothetical protein
VPAWATNAWRRRLGHRGAFDVVLSTFGVMFTAQPERAVAELLRVCRPGGRIGLANWTPDSFVAKCSRSSVATTREARAPTAAPGSPTRQMGRISIQVVNPLGESDQRFVVRLLSLSDHYHPPSMDPRPGQTPNSDLSRPGSPALARPLLPAR